MCLKLLSMRATCLQLWMHARHSKMNTQSQLILICTFDLTEIVTGKLDAKANTSLSLAARLAICAIKGLINWEATFDRVRCVCRWIGDFEGLNRASGNVLSFSTVPQRHGAVPRSCRVRTIETGAISQIDSVSTVQHYSALVWVMMAARWASPS